LWSFDQRILQKLDHMSFQKDLTDVSAIVIFLARGQLTLADVWLIAYLLIRVKRLLLSAIKRSLISLFFELLKFLIKIFNKNLFGNKAIKIVVFYKYENIQPFQNNPWNNWVETNGLFNNFEHERFGFSLTLKRNFNYLNLSLHLHTNYHSK
jgi:hypothetical protein